MPVLDCGVNTIKGPPTVGTGFAGTRNAARTIAINVADGFISAIFNAAAPTYTCPPVECKNKNVEAVVNRKVRDLAVFKIKPGFWYAAVMITWDMRFDCRYAA